MPHPPDNGLDPPPSAIPDGWLQHMLGRWLSRVRVLRGLASTPSALSAAAPATNPRINLALQGGGAHGAFTWGVLDALSHDPRIQVEGISGSSAGAMNAVVFAHGWMQDGATGARRSLNEFWTNVARHMPMGMRVQGAGDAIDLSPASKWLMHWAGHFSPSQLNPHAINPLREVLSAQVDFAALRRHSPCKLFVGATHVATGRLRVFREHELTLDMLLASACLPKIHHAVEIEGEAYWDGGYSANPALFPLLYDCEAADVLLVLLSPLLRFGTPHTVQEIDERIATLAFSAHFNREMGMLVRAAECAGKTLSGGGHLEQRLLTMRYHMIDTSAVASLHRTDTKLLPHLPFLEFLRDQGQLLATEWLATQAQHIGEQSSLDLKKYFG